MRKIISTLLLLGAMVLSAQAQVVVINEISYNTPGTDVEYIELYNNTSNSINLSGWTINQAVTYTFPSGVSIPGNGYILVTGDSLDMQSVFGVAAYEWPSGGLNNSGESIILNDNNGRGVDTVSYEDDPPWPEICDGLGPALILCDVNSDNNDPANWSFSTNATAVYDSDTTVLFGSPGLANSCTGSGTPTVFMNGTYKEVSEGAGTIRVDLILAAITASDTTDVTINVSMSSTASAGTDYTFTSGTTMGIGSKGVNKYTFASINIPIVNDMMVEPDEFLVLTFSNPTNGAVLADNTPLTIKITDDDIPMAPPPRYPIGLITADANNDGAADSIGTVCEIQGIVHGFDVQFGSNIGFTIIDSTGGISLFNRDDFGYTPTEGDELLIRGKVDEFNGLAQMEDIDTIKVISTGNPTVTPVVVTTLDETTESEMVALECVSIIDTSAWPTVGAGSGANVDVTNGVDTFAIRIDRDVDVTGTPVPTSKWLNISGIGGQFTFSTPQTDGYQLLPRYMADVVELGNPAVSFGTANDTIDEAGATVSVAVDIMNGNPDTTSVTVSLAAASSTATEGADFTFSDVTLDFDGCGAGNASFDVNITDDTDIEGDETIVLVISSVTNSAETSIDTVTIVITDNDNVGIDNQLNADAINLYPNPATDKLVIDASLPMENLQVLNLVGQEVMNIAQPTQKTTLSVTHLPKGTYLVRALTAEGVWMAKWVKM